MASISLSSLSSGEENYMTAVAEKYRDDVHDLGEGISSDGTTVPEDSDIADCSWKTAVRKKSKKRPRVRSNSDGVLHEKNNKIPKFSRSTPTHSEGKVVIVGLENKNVCRANPVKVVKQIHDLVGRVKDMVKERNMLIVRCESENQIPKLLELTQLAGINVKVTRYDGSQSTTKGVIHKIDPQISNEEIEEVLKEQNVVNAKRFMKKIKGEMVATPSVLLTFKGKNLPESIHFLYEVKQVDDYIPPVPRCHKCQLFGHIRQTCKGNIRCVRCGGEHEFEDCPNKENPKCLRCGENHSAAYQGCKFYAEAKQIQKIKLQENLTYAQAAKAHRAQIHENAVTDMDNQKDMGSANLNKPAKKHNTESRPNNPQRANPNPQRANPNPQAHTPHTVRERKGQEERDRAIPRSHSQIPIPVRKTKKETATQTPVNMTSIDLIMFILFVVRQLPQSSNDDNFLEAVVRAGKEILKVDITMEMVKSRLI